MYIRNFLTAPLTPTVVHGGHGKCPHANIIPREAFATPVKFVNYTILPPGAAYGAHKHGDDNEMYIALSGAGRYHENGEARDIRAGDIMLNPPQGEHWIENTGDEDLPLLVIGVGRE